MKPTYLVDNPCMRLTLFLSALLHGTILATTIATAQQNRIDVVRHDAPELARYGHHDIGVRTVEWTNPNQVDVISSEGLEEPAYYDRTLTIDIWYPARLAENEQPGGTYVTSTRNLSVTATLHGRAVRDAAPDHTIGASPLVIISHGYPGNRYLMSHLAENLASKGYVVASIDHRESTYDDQGSIWSTLYHRSLDQRFVIDKITDLSESNGHFLNQIVDTGRTGIVGYSMGGYGLLVNLGAGYTDATAASAESLPESIARRHASNNPELAINADTRIKAGIAIAPCCMNRGMWDPASLATIKTPLFLMAGSADDTAGYENGVRAIFEQAANSDRYLLTFLHAGHNAIAPIPLPAEIHASSDQAGAFHYTDAVWDSTRSSNIMFHFATVFLDLQLKHDPSRGEFLQLVTHADDGTWSDNEDTPDDQHTYWHGFPRYTARGLVLEHLAPTGR